MSVRIKAGEAISARELMALLDWRQRFITETAAAMEGFDGMLMPTVAITPPPIETLDDDEAYYRTNRLVLRNTSIINSLDGCALSIPMHRPDELPMGLMVSGLPMQDERILSVGLTIEQILQPALRR